MKLDTKLIRDFARSTNDQKRERNGRSAYGVIVMSGETKCVKLDGSDQLTPVSEAMDADPGDRVIVMIKNHTAVVTGNLSCPASARTASKYLKFTDADGLIIGNLVNDVPSGVYSQIAPGTFYVRSESGIALASFGVNGIAIGTDSKTKITIDTTNGLRLGTKISLDANGNASFNGAVTATSLSLGTGVTVPYSKVSDTPDLSIYIYKDGRIGDVPAEGATGFVVSSAGVLKAASAIIYGTIYTSAGKIGGWSISGDAIAKETQDGNYRVRIQAMASPTNGNYAIRIDQKSGSDWANKIALTYGGKLIANDAQISGQITAKSGNIGNFTVSTTENTGTSANGGHFYTNSLYAHSGDDTYEYEIGIKGDGNNTSAGHGNLAFYAKRITKGAAWSTGVNTFYITKSGQFAVIGAKTQVLIDPRATNVFRIQKYANNAWSNVIYMDADGDAHFTGTITGSSGEFTKSFYMGVPKNLTGAVDTNTIWVDNNTFWFVKRIKPTNSTQYIIGGMSVETNTSNNKPYTNIYGQEIHLISDGTVVIESDFKILNGTVKSNITSEGTFVGKTISGHTNRTMVGSQSDDGQRVGMIRYTASDGGGIACQNGTAGSSYAWRNFSVSSSDIRLKKNVEDCEVDSALDVINQIKMRSFDWLHTDEHQKIGFIADELELIDPKLSMGGGTERDGTVNYKSVDTFYLMGYLVKSIQELTKELNKLKRKGEAA